MLQLSSCVLQHTCVGVLQSWQLLPLSTRQRTFFKYEKRIRDLSGPDKIFEYFATETKEDGSRCALTCSVSEHAALTPHCTQNCVEAAVLKTRLSELSLIVCVKQAAALLR